MRICEICGREGKWGTVTIPGLGLMPICRDCHAIQVALLSRKLTMPLAVRVLIIAQQPRTGMAAAWQEALKLEFSKCLLHGEWLRAPCDLCGDPYGYHGASVGCIKGECDCRAVNPFPDYQFPIKEIRLQ